MSRDLTSYFPEFDGPEMRRFKEVLQKGIASLYEKAASLPALDSESEPAWSAVFLQH